MKTCKTCSKPFDPVQSTELVGPYLGGSETTECPSCTEDAIYELARKSRSHLSVENGRIYWNEPAEFPAKHGTSVASSGVIESASTTETV